MWFMPSYGRPQALAHMMKAPGGWPELITVLINADDPKRAEYLAAGKASRWDIVTIPAGSRCADAHRFITIKWPNEPFYGLLMDDLWPVTSGWDAALITAAGDRFFSITAGEASFPLLRSAIGMGGDLVRAMGSLVPLPVKHNYEDNVWDMIAADFNLLKPLPDFIVEHRHWNLVRDDLAVGWTTKQDATYVRGSHDMDEDGKVFKAWVGSVEQNNLYARIRNFLEQ